jgi:hypothetical protein
MRKKRKGVKKVFHIVDPKEENTTLCNFQIKEGSLFSETVSEDGAECLSCLRRLSEDKFNAEIVSAIKK